MLVNEPLKFFLLFLVWFKPLKTCRCQQLQRSAELNNQDKENGLVVGIIIMNKNQKSKFVENNQEEKTRVTNSYL